MAVFRVEKNSGYTVMSNHHLRNRALSLKAKGLLSQMLSLPEDWDYTLQGLARINRESIDAIRQAIRELEQAGYIQRSRERDEKGRLRGADYVIFELPQPVPASVSPTLENPTLENPTQENRPDLFGKAQYPNASTIKQPTYYDIPPEALKDDRFAAMMEEATKYIGYPYVWGGSSPSTSFDCSGYISWVLNHSGWNVGRQTAQGLYNLCTPVSAAQVKPGDLVFFKGTYDTPGVSHCGIYVGNSIMLHCGDPISYTNLNSKYWQEHFYSYGRLP